jgi:hypothetical protein
MFSLLRRTKTDPFAKVAIGDEPGIEYSTQEYIRIAEKVGVRLKPATKDTLLAGILNELMIGAIDRSAVERYMDAKKGYWKWFPLRADDQSRHPIVRLTTVNHPTLYGALSDGVYTDPIPLPVMITIERIVDRCGVDAQFYIGAVDTDPDPFLYVRLRSDPDVGFVIERWDEPGFRDTKKNK